MKKILVTGGVGFIGSHLCTLLIKKENEVIFLDNFLTGSKKNIEHLLRNLYFQFLQHDITNPIQIEVNEIYNLTCPASPIHYQHNPIHTIKRSVLEVINMLDLTSQTNTKILQTLASEVYGDPAIHPQIEEYWGNVNPIRVRSCYDEGKRCGETLFMDYHLQKHVNIKVIRIFNTYVLNMSINDGKVISNFIIQAIRNEGITIYGNGSQKRSFQYIDDLTDAMTRMIQTPDNFTGPVNIGKPEEFTIKELAEIIIYLTKSQSKIIYKPLPEDDPKQRKSDISLATEILLGWKPSVKLEEGLKKQLNIFGKKFTSKYLLMR